MTSRCEAGSLQAFCTSLHLPAGPTEHLGTIIMSFFVEGATNSNVVQLTTFDTEGNWSISIPSKNWDFRMALQSHLKHNHAFIIFYPQVFHICSFAEAEDCIYTNPVSSKQLEMFGKHTLVKFFECTKPVLKNVLHSSSSSSFICNFQVFQNASCTLSLLISSQITLYRWISIIIPILQRGVLRPQAT